jgi:hypothetical protein
VGSEAHSFDTAETDTAETGSGRPHARTWT